MSKCYHFISNYQGLDSRNYQNDLELLDPTSDSGILRHQMQYPNDSFLQNQSEMIIADNFTQKYICPERTKHQQCNCGGSTLKIASVANDEIHV